MDLQGIALIAIPCFFAVITCQTQNIELGCVAENYAIAAAERKRANGLIAFLPFHNKVTVKCENNTSKDVCRLGLVSQFTRIVDSSCTVRKPIKTIHYLTFKIPNGTYTLGYEIKIPPKLYPFGNMTDHLMPRIDDGWATFPISRQFPFFDSLYSVIYPNWFGCITFKGPMSQLPLAMPTKNNFRIIGPYWSHMVPTSCTTSTAARSRGDVFLRETVDPDILQRATRDIRAAIPSEAQYSAKWAYIMSWYQVRMPNWGCSAEHTTFQLIISTDGVKSFAMFIYHEMGNSSNHCAHQPTGGIDAGDGVRALILPSSGSGPYGNFSETLISESNVGRPGVFIYRVDGNVEDPGYCDPQGSTLRISPRFGSLLGGTTIIVSGVCLENTNYGYNVTCRIDNVPVPANVSAQKIITCITPLNYRLGRVLLEVSVDGGHTFLYNTTYTYEYVSSDVIFLNEHQLNQGASSTIDLQWDQSAFLQNDTVLVQMLTWFSRPIVSTSNTSQLVSQWTATNTFQAVIMELSVSPNTGVISVPVSTVMNNLPADLAAYAASFRVITERDSHRPSEQNGLLDSHSIYSPIKPLPFLQHFENRPYQVAPVKPPIFVKFTDAVGSFYNEYKKKIDCGLELAHQMAWDLALSTMTGGLAVPYVTYKRARRACEVYSMWKDAAGKVGHAEDIAGLILCGLVEKRSLSNKLTMKPVPPCPTSLGHALRDASRYPADPSCRQGSLDPSNCLWNNGSHHCVVTATTAQGVASQCCYSASGQLLHARDTNSQGAGILRNAYFNGHRQETSLSTRMVKSSVWDTAASIFAAVQSTLDTAAMGFCCMNGDPKLCSEFMNKAFGRDSKFYVPLRPAATFTDPHMVTFDGCRYTFNGFGEYVISQIPGVLTLQGRTKKTANGRATVWQAIAVRGPSAITVQVQYNEIRTIEAYIDGKYVDFDQEPEIIRNGDMTIARKPCDNGNGTVQHGPCSMVHVLFENGAAVEVKSVEGMLDLVVYLPDSAKGKSSGLFGAWNGNTDLLTPAGIPYHCNGTAEQLFEFGNDWRVKKVDSLFSYMAPDTYESLNDETYRPAFGIPVLNETMQSESRKICGENSECLFDFAITGNKAIASVAVALAKEFEAIVNETKPITSCGYRGPGFNAATSLDSGNYLEGSSLLFECVKYKQFVNGSKNITCGGSGNWSGDSLVCGDIPCKPLQLTLSFVVNSTNGLQTSFIAGEEVTLACEGENMPISGERVVFCNEEGNWNHEPLKCSSTCLQFSLTWCLVFLSFLELFRNVCSYQ